MIRIIYIGWVLVLGLLSGMTAWFLLTLFDLVHQMSHSLILFNEFIYQGMLIGMGLNCFFFTREEWVHANLKRLGQRLPVAAGGGLLCGLLSFGLALSLKSLPWYIPPELIRVLSWICLLTALGAVLHLNHPPNKDTALGLAAALLAGILTAGLQELLIDLLPPVYASLLLLLAAAVMLHLFTVAPNFLITRSFLRILNGDDEGKAFLLDQPHLTLGYNHNNNIVLHGYAEVCKQHAGLRRVDKEFEISNMDSGQLLVNYRPIDAQVLKTGDIIKIGTALIQLCEVR